MFGFNVTSTTFSYDNRPVTPLVDLSFSKWWFHGHLDYPPHPQDVFELPAGENVTTQIACDKSATTFYNSSEGGNIQEASDPNNVCPGSPTSEYHTTGLSDVKGCALAIAYKSNVSEVQPADFTVFSVNQTCVWNRYTDFSVPAKMPPCPDNLCYCAFFWIHSPDSGSEQSMPIFYLLYVLSYLYSRRLHERIPMSCHQLCLHRRPCHFQGCSSLWC